MTDDDSDGLDERFARLYKEGRGEEDSGDHPSPEKLSAYQAGELPAGEREAIHEHLSRCNLCTELLLDLQSFLEPVAAEPPRENVADLRAEAGWREVRGMLSTSRSRRRITIPAWAASVILALLLTPLLTSIYWIQDLRGQVSESRTRVSALLQPRVNIPTLEMSGTRGGGDWILTETTLLDLRTSDPREYASYQVDITTDKGMAIWSSPLQKDHEGKLTLTLMDGFLKPGSYRIRLWGLVNGRPSLLESFPLQVASGDASQDG